LRGNPVQASIDATAEISARRREALVRK
jgi:hypothetical protein